MREVAFTARYFSSQEALSFGLISKIFDTKNDLNKGTLQLAKNIASKSQIAIRGIKKMCNYCLDHPVSDCQDYVAVWNSSMSQSIDAMRNMKPTRTLFDSKL